MADKLNHLETDMSLTRVDLTAIQHEANKRIMQSIVINGLCSLKNLSNADALTNPVLQSRALDGLICVNSVNLQDATETEKQTIFNTLAYEEYTGIYGIAAERQSPFQNFKNYELLKEELNSRLMNSMVFIVSAPWGPQLTVTHQQIDAVVQPTTLRLYQYGDAISQSRGKILIDKIVPFTNRVNEISTSITFERFSTLAILVPEHFLALAKEIFGDKIDMIPVLTGKVILKSIPQILELLHKEKINDQVTVEAPLYKTAIEEYSKNSRYSEFSVHTVRLQTPFDFMVRVLDNCFKPASQSLLREIQATIVDAEKSVVVVHKQFGISRINKIQKQELFPPATMQKIVKAHEATELFTARLKQEISHKMIYIYKPLSLPQINYLANVDKTKIIEFHKNCYAISFEEKHHEIIKEAILNFNKIETKAANCIQRLFHRHHARKIVREYKQAKNEYISAEQKLHQLIKRGR